MQQHPGLGNFVRLTANSGWLTFSLPVLTLLAALAWTLPASASNAWTRDAKSESKLEVLPQPLPSETALQGLYWDALRASLVERAGNRPDLESIDAIIARLKLEVSAESCDLMSAQWHPDLQILQTTLRCKMVPHGQTGSSQSGSTQESIALSLTPDSAGWQLSHAPADQIACASARRTDDHPGWSRYLRKFPGGACRDEAMQRTMPAARVVNVIQGETGFHFGPDGKSLYSLRTLSDGMIRLSVRNEQGDLVRSHDIQAPESVDAISVSANGRYVLSRHRDKVRLHDLFSDSTVTLNVEGSTASDSTGCGVEMAFDSGRDLAVLALCFTHRQEGRNLADTLVQSRASQEPGTPDQTQSTSLITILVSSYFVKDGAQTSAFTIEGDLARFALSPDGARLAVIRHAIANEPQRIDMYDTSMGKMLWQQFITDPLNASVDRMTWSSQGEVIAISTGNTTRLRETIDGKVIELPTRGNRLVKKQIALTDDGKRFLMHDTEHKWVTVYDAHHDKNIFRYDYGKAGVETRAKQPAAQVMFGPAAQPELFLVQEDDKATLFQINDIGVRRVIKDGMDRW